MIGLAFLIMAAAVSVTLLSARLAAKLSRILREKVFEKVMSFTNSEFDKFSTASLITRSTNDIQQIQMFYDDGIPYRRIRTINGDRRYFQSINNQCEDDMDDRYRCDRDHVSDLCII
mgnify:CR=1 FL=1